MKSIVYESFGIENLKEVERPIPEPGYGEVLLKMKAASLNYRDLLMLEGGYNPRLKMPLVPCSDGVGIIEKLGEGATKFKTGTRVSPIFARGWHDGPPFREMLKATHGGPLDGTLQQYMVVPEADLVEIPDSLTDEQAASLPCAGLTAWSAIAELGGAKPGQSILILGTGGVSTFAIQFAKLFGLEIIVTSSSNEKLSRAVEMGAAHTVNYSENANWDRSLFKITKGAGVDHVIEVGGVGTLEKSIRSTKPGGSIYLIGVLAGKEAPLDLTPVLMQSIRIQGVVVGHRSAFERMLKAIEQNSVEPVIDSVFGSGDSVAAFEKLKSGSHFGKICIKID